MEQSKRFSDEVDMLHGSLLPKILRFAIPVALSGLLQLLFTATDTVIVGRFAGDASLAAVGSNASLMGLFTNLFIGMSVGSNIVVSRHYAQENWKSVDDAVHTSVLLGLLGGVLLAVIGFFSAHRILQWMNCSDEVLLLATLYLKIVFLGMPAMLVYNFGAAIMRSVGQTKAALYYLIASGALNVVLNLCFVVNLSMGVAGVALATVMTQTLSAALVIRYLIRTPGRIHLTPSRIRVDRVQLFDIIRTGVPAGIQSILFSIADTFVQSSVNSLGDTVMSGNAAATNYMSFPYTLIVAFNQTALVFISQNASAGKWKRARSSLYLCAAASLSMQTLAIIVSMWKAKTLLGLYTTSAAVIGAGLIRMQIILPFYALYALFDLATNALRALGHPMLPTVITVGGVCVLRLAWLAVMFRQPQYHTIQTIYWAYPLSWTVSFVVGMICLIWVWRREEKCTV